MPVLRIPVFHIAGMSCKVEQIHTRKFSTLDDKIILQKSDSHYGLVPDME